MRPRRKRRARRIALAELLPEKVGRYSLLDIARYAKLDSRAVTEKLWSLAWQGLVTNDAFATIRQGILTDFAPVPLKTERGRPSRSAYNRWAASRPLAGSWYAIDTEGIERDPIDDAELVKDRVRQLFRRYGILFREILAGELPPLQWAKIFRALRLMELSGEILSGYFFEGIPGAQFISHEAFRFLQEPLPEESGLLAERHRPRVPLRRQAGGAQGQPPQPHSLDAPGLSRQTAGGDFAPQRQRPGFPGSPRRPAHPRVSRLLQGAPHPAVQPGKNGSLVETINGKPALESEYAKPLDGIRLHAIP